MLKESYGTVSYYFETSDGGTSGFLDDDCFFRFLMSSIYNLDKGLSADDPTWHIFRDSTKGSSFLFRPVENGSGTEVEFSQFDQQGSLIATKFYPFRE